MEEGLQSPKPGWYEYEKPYGWEEEGDLSRVEIEFREAMAGNPDYDYSEDPILKAMRLEAEADQAKKHYRAPRKHAKLIKDHIVTARKLNFDSDRRPSKVSVSSYETDDFMSQPDTRIYDEQGENAWMAAYKAKAQRHKRLRKMLANAPAASPVKAKMPSPVKIAQAYAQQSPAVQKAVAAVLAASPPPPPSPKKFGDINLDSSDDEVPLPTNFAKKMSKAAGKKSFFASPSPGKAKSPSPFKPLPAAIKKSFFAAPNLDSDSDSDIDIPGLTKISSPKKFSVTKKSFFASPSKQ